MDEWEGKFGTPDGLIPLVGQKRHSLGAGTFNHATAASGVKVAQHPQGLTLTPAPGGGARWWVGGARSLAIRKVSFAAPAMRAGRIRNLSLIHISEPTRQAEISYAVF